MSRKILIYVDINEIEYGVFDNTDYSKLYEQLLEERGGNCPNWGNKVWFEGIISEITTPHIEYEFKTSSMTPQEINEKYDGVLMPCANIFSVEFMDEMVKLTKVFEQLQIPVYVISCGLQLDKMENMDSLVSRIKEVSTKFIDTVYKTGGEFCLRGYLTKEFLDKLGFPQAVVAGCPSLYQMGKNIAVTKPDVSQNEFKAVVNSQNYHLNTKFYKSIFKKYTDSIYIDQDHYYRYLYQKDYFNGSTFGTKENIMRIKDKGLQGLDLVSDNKLLLFADVPNWIKYLQNSDYSFSFGARIHGNITSILSGIPAMVHICDCRTREIAEYYNIPIITDEDLAKEKDIYDIYEKLDYSTFNAKFPELFDKYEAFLRKCDLIENINQDNIFVDLPSNHNGEAPEVVNKAELESLHKALSQKHAMYALVDGAFNVYRKCFK